MRFFRSLGKSLTRGVDEKQPCRLSPDKGLATGLPRSNETVPPWDPTVGLCLGPYGGPGGGGLFLESEVSLLWVG